MTLPPVRTQLVLVALAIVATAGLADWAFMVPDDPLDALMGTVIAGGSATAFILPLLSAP